jgi:hypothetical protein
VHPPDSPLDAGRWFDPEWYNVRNPDVPRVGIDPLSHYLRYGEAEGRRPSPWFDPVWYRQIYEIPPDEYALAHFLAHRASGQFLPCAALYTVLHTAPWRADPGIGVDPFDHYLTDMETPERELLPDLAVFRSRGLFDHTYFRINPANQFEIELDPALHYCRFGWRRGLRPNTAFDPEWYAETNPDVTPLRINPLSHYILEGESVDHRPVPWIDLAWYRTRYHVPPGELVLTHYLRHRGGGTVSPNPLFDVEWYKAQYGATIPAGIDPFSHYLLRGALEDVDPGPRFDAAAWRHQHMAPIGADGQSELPVAARNPLVHHLTSLHAAG